MARATFLQRGDKFFHQTLGLCEIREVCDDGTVTVCTAEIYNDNNTFRLHPPTPGLHRYNFDPEMGI